MISETKKVDLNSGKYASKVEDTLISGTSIISGYYFRWQNGLERMIDDVGELK